HYLPSLFFFFLFLRRPPTSPLFPYTTLFRSRSGSSRLIRISTRSARIVISDLLQVRVSVPAAPAVHDHDRRAGTARHRRPRPRRSEEHTSELQSLTNLVCRLLLEKKKQRECN